MKTPSQRCLEIKAQALAFAYRAPELLTQYQKDVLDLLAHIEEMERERINLPAWLEKVGDLEYEKDQLEQKVEALNAQVEKAKEIADALQPGYAPKDGEYFCSYCQAKSLPVDTSHTEGCLQAMCEQLLEGGQKP